MVPREQRSLHSGHPGHMYRCALFLSFSCPVPALAPECCECGPCGCPSHSDTGLRPAGPLTGSTCQPSWRVAPGSRPDGQRFQSDDRWADALNIWLLTRGPANLVRRCTDYRTGLVLQRCSHILYRFFYLQCAAHFQCAGQRFQLLCSLLSGSPVHRYTPGKRFQSAPVGVFSRGRCSGRGLR